MQKITTGMLLAVATGFWPMLNHSSPLPDPTRPANYFTRTTINEDLDLPEKVIDWKLTAIQISDRRRTAIVNGRILKAGDEIGNVTVLKITPNSVVLDYGGKQLVVNLIPYSVKKAPVKRST